MDSDTQDVGGRPSPEERRPAMSEPQLSPSGSEPSPVPSDLPPTTWLWDVREILFLSLPCTAAQLFRVANVSIVLIMCGGHLHPADFAGLMLGQSLTNIVVTSPGIGFSSVLDTLVTQECGRCSTSSLMGLHLRRALVAGGVWIVLCAVILAVFAESLCTLLFGTLAGSPAAAYLRIGFIQSMAMVFQTCIQKFLSAQGVVDVAVWAQAASIVTLIACLAVAVPYGITGIAVASTVGRLTSLLVCVWLGRRRPGVLLAWGNWSFSRVVDRNEFTRFLIMAIPSLLTTCAERWTFDTLTVLAGLLGVVPSAAWGLMLNIWVVLFSPSVGNYTAGSTLVGNAIGAGRPDVAKRLSYRVFVVQWVVQVVLCGLLWFRPALVLAAYTNTPDVMAVATAIAPLLSIAIFSDATSYTMQGLLRGAADLQYVAGLTLVAQWGMSFAISAALLHRWWSLSAVTTGVAIGSSLQLVGLGLRLQHLDWDRLAQARFTPLEDAVATEEMNVVTNDLPFGEPCS